MLELTSREHASVLVGAIVCTLVFVASEDPRELTRLLRELLASAMKWKLVLPVVALGGWVAGVVAASRLIGLWESDLLKETLIASIFVGLPLTLSFGPRAASGLLRSWTVRTVGATVFLVAYINLSQLPLWSEFLLQSIVVPLTLLAAISSARTDSACLSRGSSALLGAIGVLLLVATTVQVVGRFDTFDWDYEARALAVSIWLPAAILPFAYVLHHTAATEVVLTRLKIRAAPDKVPTRIKTAVVLGVVPRLFYATAFNGLWAARVLDTTSFLRAIAVMRSFRSAVRSNGAEARRRSRRLRKNVGLQGRDAAGLWMDRREFFETKKMLGSLYYNQMGWHRNRLGHYQPDRRSVVPTFSHYDRSIGESITLDVRGDQQAWAGWRTTPSGYCFAIGGTEEIDKRWEYDGEDPPSTFPGSTDGGWRETTLNESSADWRHDDSPPRGHRD